MRPGALLPFKLKHFLRTQLRRAAGLSERDDLLTQWHTPWPGRNPRGVPGYTLDAAYAKTDPGPDGLPMPPRDMRMGYFYPDETYLELGRNTAQVIRELFHTHGATLGEGSRLLDWGCGPGRVLRHFAPEAQHAECWGADQDEASMLWCRGNLAPPFRFVTCPTYPHLPFADHHFDALFAVSVFTHLEYLPDLWLMELRRILKPGGVAVVSFLDEDAAAQMRTDHRPPYITDTSVLDPAGKAEAYVLQGPDWALTLPFYTRAHVEQRWGTMVDILEIRPKAIDGYQCALVFTKQG